MENCNLDFVNEVYRNVSVALLSINDVTDSVADSELKNELRSEYEKYQEFSNDIKDFMREKGYEIKDVSKMKKFMMWSAIKMNTAMDDSKSHVAEIMIKGTVMGITELNKILNDSASVNDEKAKDFAKRLLSLQEEFEENLKRFL
ncbi:MAG: hypothetical protein J6V66_00570 [Clostridia bacterium]|nr:hypothetical protein [Clostridia bacterium]